MIFSQIYGFYLKGYLSIYTIKIVFMVLKEASDKGKVLRLWSDDE